MSWNPSNGVGFLVAGCASSDSGMVERWLDEQRMQPGCVGWRRWNWDYSGTYAPGKREYCAQAIFLDRQPYRQPCRTPIWLTEDTYPLFGLEWGRSYYARLP